MANKITLKNLPTEEWLSMSNGATDVFVDVLKICHKTLPSNRESYALTAWIIEQHESRIGDGFSGFDISDMPWDSHIFDSQKKCLLSVIDAMSDKSNLSELGYEPNEEILLRHIREFRNLLLKMTIPILHIH